MINNSAMAIVDNPMSAVAELLILHLFEQIIIKIVSTKDERSN